MPKKLQRFLPLIAFVIVLFALQNWWRVDLLLNPIDSTALSEQDIILYSTNWCPYCQKARTFFRQANIPFTEYDIEQSARAYQQYQQLGGRGVPVITIGDQIIQGYDPKAMRTALAQLTTAK